MVKPGDYFYYNSWNQFKETNYMFKKDMQIVVGRVIRDADEHWHYKLLYGNMEWVKHNFHPDVNNEHQWHHQSPFHRGLVVVTEQEAHRIVHLLQVIH